MRVHKCQDFSQPPIACTSRQTNWGLAGKSPRNLGDKVIPKLTVFVTQHVLSVMSFTVAQGLLINQL